MSSIVADPPKLGTPPAPRALPPTARGRLHHLRRRPRLTLFLASFIVYAAIGYKVVVLQHVVVPDGWARLAHAYFVFHNHPPKLAAIGFIWPPLMTLVFLPLAWITPLATSLAALPLTSAFFGAATI